MLSWLQAIFDDRYRKSSTVSESSYKKDQMGAKEVLLTKVQFIW